jgi:hypothetical protein
MLFEYPIQHSRKRKTLGAETNQWLPGRGEGREITKWYLEIFCGD